MNRFFQPVSIFHTVIALVWASENKTELYILEIFSLHKLLSRLTFVLLPGNVFRASCWFHISLIRGAWAVCSDSYRENSNESNWETGKVSLSTAALQQHETTLLHHHSCDSHTSKGWKGMEGEPILQTCFFRAGNIMVDNLTTRDHLSNTMQ